jgi:hypothetical protein
MKKLTTKNVIIGALLIGAIFSISPRAMGESIGSAIDKINEINQMRESLAASLEHTKVPITEQTFKNVCAPVGKSLMDWAKSQGHEARQLSDKYRNPKNKAEGVDLQAIEEFRKNKARQVITEVRTVGGVAGTQIYRRIDVQQNCLHCHGPASSLPEFIKTKYPTDLANEFKAGDLRGVYSIWIRKSH